MCLISHFTLSTAHLLQCIAMAADQGGSGQQLIDFFGWMNVNMTSKYVNTFKKSITNTAQNLDYIELREEKTAFEEEIPQDIID